MAISDEWDTLSKKERWKRFPEMAEHYFKTFTWKDGLNIFVWALIVYLIVGVGLKKVNYEAQYCTYSRDESLGQPMGIGSPLYPLAQENPQQNMTLRYYINWYNSRGGLPEGTHLKCHWNFSRFISGFKWW